MSKKNREGSKRQQRQEATPVIEKESKKGKSAKKETGQKPMLNLLLLLTAILPFMFSWELMDGNLTVRYGLLAGFVLLFILYFYGFRKKLITGGWPLLARIVFILGIAYGIWNMISLFTATNQQQAYYGISRHFLNMLLLFIVSQIAANEESYLVRLCQLLSVAAIIHSLIGVCQFYDVAFNDIPGNFKPYGLMGNRNLYGTAQVLLLPFSIFSLYKSSKPWKYIAGLAIAGIAVSAILSQTRSAWLAGLVSVIGGLILVLLYSPGNRKKWIKGTVVSFAAIAALAFLLITTDKEGELSRSLKERTGNMFTADTTGGYTAAADNINERLKIWSKTTELIKANWLTGVGAGNWKIDVAKYGTEGLSWAEGKYVPDSPHNDYLLVIAESGIPGALIYLGMWLLIGVIAFKTIIKSQTEERRILNIVMVAGLAGFALDSMFSFPSERIEHSLYVYLMAGIIIGSFISNFNGAPQKFRLKNWQLAIFGVIAAFNLFLSIKKYSFEKHLVLSKLYEDQGVKQQNANAFQLSIEEGNKGKNAFVSVSPNGFPIEAFIGLSYKGLKKYPEALKEMSTAINYHPYNKALLINKGTVYTVMNKYDTAIQYYNRALKLTPKFDVIYFNLAMNYFHLQKYQECLDALSKVDIGTNKDLINIKLRAEYELSLKPPANDKPAQ
jgi:O-antigen ligase